MEDGVQRTAVELGESLHSEPRNDYNHLAFKNSSSSTELFENDNKYDHAIPTKASRSVKTSMYDHVQLESSLSSYQEDLKVTQNTISRCDQGEVNLEQTTCDFINPYVDDVVAQGIKSQRDFMKSQISIDKAMTDMVNLAQDWAFPSNDDKHKTDRYDLF